METTDLLKNLFGVTPYETLIAETKDFAVFHIDSEGRIVSWNKGAELIFGYVSDEIIGQPGSILFTSEDRMRNVPQMEIERAELDGRAEDVRWHLRKDGTRFYANGVTTALRDEAGILRGFAKIARDDTARKQTEQALERSNERIGIVLESITEAFFVLDHDWRFTYLNKQSDPLLLRSREELLGKNLWDEFPETRGSVFYDQYNKAVAKQVTDYV